MLNEENTCVRSPILHSAFCIHHSAFDLHSAFIMPGSDEQPLEQALAALTGHAIVAGFGIPGREVANLFASLRFPYCVVEMNPATVHRCTDTGLLILQGDATDEQTLLKAGIERAAVLALAMPNEQAVLKGIPL